ncbi:MAG: Fic family protein [Verrucomicrobia bacterium]|nr:Fic family protein [Verrucomicrobiota bacterium]
MYIHLREDWPAFRWDEAKLASVLTETRHAQGRLLGRMEGLGFGLRGEADLAIMTSEIVKSSAIEGEVLDDRQVRSSLARRLGVDVEGTTPVSRAVEGVVEMMLDATRRYEDPLSEERLCNWHAALFPTGRSGLRRITVGTWRPAEAGPMQVVSGVLGREKVHFEAPEATRLQGEMRTFLDWFNSEPGTDPVIKAALAHLWFVTIHPFEDGNGRIARAIADMALARADGTAQRFYSMSAQIEADRSEYYAMLEQTQKGDMDVTAWLSWFVACLSRSLARAQGTLSAVLRKARVWQRLSNGRVNDRQRKVINRLLDGFEGHLTSSKYAKLTNCSPDTALRDIRELLDRGVLLRNPGGGRSASYQIAGPMAR